MLLGEAGVQECRREMERGEMGVGRGEMGEEARGGERRRHNVMKGREEMTATGFPADPALSAPHPLQYNVGAGQAGPFQVGRDRHPSRAPPRPGPGLTPIIPLLEHAVWFWEVVCTRKMDT